MRASFSHVWLFSKNLRILMLRRFCYYVSFPALRILLFNIKKFSTGIFLVPIWNSKTMRMIQRVVLSRPFKYFGVFVVLLNAIMMTVEISIHYEQAFQAVFSDLNIINYVFVGKWPA